MTKDRRISAAFIAFVLAITVGFNNIMALGVDFSLAAIDAACIGVLIYALIGVCLSLDDGEEKCSGPFKLKVDENGNIINQDELMKHISEVTDKEPPEEPDPRESEPIMVLTLTDDKDSDDVYTQVISKVDRMSIDGKDIIIKDSKGVTTMTVHGILESHIKFDDDVIAMLGGKVEDENTED